MMRANELRDRYAAGERNFSGVNLSFADLSQFNLEGADLSRAVLMGAKLERANLKFANLYGAHLENADLTDASLFYANLRRAKLCNANFTGAELRAANLTETNLTGANLSDADLHGATLPKGFTRNTPVKVAPATNPPAEHPQETIRFIGFQPIKLIERVFGKRKKPIRREFLHYLSLGRESPNSKQATDSMWVETENSDFRY